MNTRETAARVARRLREAGFEALFAGGCVRDRLRGVEPHDYDIATSAPPEAVQGLFLRTAAVGAAFGVILVREGDETVEVATFREDVGTLDGRHPAAVRFADARADALRRDFTVNGMFEDPETGEILDFVEGRADVQGRWIRAIGDPRSRFREDRLRLLRAVRFATVLDYRIEPKTYAALREESGGITAVSAERVRDELTRILVSRRGGRGIALLHEAGLLESILPEVEALDGVEQPPRFHPEGDVFTHTRMMLDAYREGGEIVALAALLHDVGKPPTATIRKGRIAFPNHAPLGASMAAQALQRLRYPNRVVEAVETLVARHMDWQNPPKMRPARRRRFLLREDFPLHAELHRLDCEACHGDLGLYRFALEERARIEAEPPPLRPLLSGHDLIALGYRPGPAFGRMLDALFDAQLEERVQTPEEARAFVSERFAPPDGRPLARESAS